VIENRPYYRKINSYSYRIFNVVFMYGGLSIHSKQRYSPTHVPCIFRFA